MDLQKILKEKEEIAYLQGIEFSVITFSDAEEIAIKYARQVAEQALKDARLNAMEVYKASGMTNLAERAGNAILSTQIVTP